MNEKEHAHFKGKLQSSNVRPHARMRTDRRQAHQNIRNKRSFRKRKTYLFRNKYTVFVFLNIPNNRALTSAVGVAFIQKQRREPENEVDKGLELISQLANWISRWFNFWPIRAQSTQFVIFNFNPFRPLSRGLGYFDFVSFGPHCLFFVFLYFKPNHSTQNVCKRYLLFYKVLRRYRRIRIQVRTVDMFV